MLNKTILESTYSKCVTNIQRFKQTQNLYWLFQYAIFCVELLNIFISTKKELDNEFTSIMKKTT